MINNENLVVCNQCGGKCCKRVPGPWSKSDVLKHGNTIRKALLNMIEKNLLQFDWWEGDILPRGELGIVYFPRPTIISNNRIAYGSWAVNDTCKLLTEKGCLLDWDNRPEGCRALVPNKNGEKFSCKPEGNGYYKETAALEWRPFQKAIVRIIESAE